MPWQLITPWICIPESGKVYAWWKVVFIASISWSTWGGGTQDWRFQPQIYLWASKTDSLALEETISFILNEFVSRVWSSFCGVTDINKAMKSCLSRCELIKVPLYWVSPLVYPPKYFLLCLAVVLWGLSGSLGSGKGPSHHLLPDPLTGNARDWTQDLLHGKYAVLVLPLQLYIILWIILEHKKPFELFIPIKIVCVSLLFFCSL